MIKNGIKNTIFEIIYYALNIIINFIIRKQIINYIGLEIVALNQILSQIINFITVLEFGICNIMVFNLYGAIKEKDNEKINNIMNIYKRIYTYITLLIAFVGICFIPFIKYFINDYSLSINYIIVYIVMLVQTSSTFLFSYKTYLLQAFQKSYLYLIIMIVFKVIFSILDIITLIKFKNYYLYLILYFVENVLTYYTISKYVDKKYKFLNDKKEEVNYNEIKKYIKSTAVSKACGTLFPSLDTFILGIISNIKIIGLYSNYYLIVSSISFAVQKVFTSFKAIIASVLNKENQYVVFKTMNIIGYITAFISSILFYCFISFVIKIWIGEDYLLSNSISLAFSIQLFYTIFRISLWQFIEIKGLFHISKISDLVGLAINFILSIVLYSKFNLLGVVIATIISLVIQYIIEIYSILKNLNKININLILEQILLITVYIITILLIKNYYLVISLIIIVLIYVIFYLKRSIYYVFKNKKNN